MGNKAHSFMKNGRCRVTAEDGDEAMDYTVNEGNEFRLKNLTNCKGLQPTPIELDSEEENLESRMAVVIEKVDKIKFFSAANSGKLVGISERTAQTWTKKIKS
ncbi:hypothetical protein G6F49_010654 [Rhizopus delemar]|nr:hypothetical protein G6F49_010654 [Rhizopus delemar]